MKGFGGWGGSIVEGSRCYLSDLEDSPPNVLKAARLYSCTHGETPAPTISSGYVVTSVVVWVVAS